MGYSIRIGEETSFVEDGYTFKDVQRIEHRDAPTFEFDEMTGNSNYRSPSYSTWRDFVKTVELDELFDELMEYHPDTVKLTWDHYDEVEHALGKFENKYPNIQPTFASDDISAHYARLIWLEWWMKYTLENFTNPVFHNR